MHCHAVQPRIARHTPPEKIRMNEVNAVYNLAAPSSLPVKIATYQRRRMFDLFLATCQLPAQDKTILDVGVTSDKAYESSNYLEAWYPCKQAITAAGIDDAGFLEQDYPGMRFVKADALDLPFGDCSFDVVHSSAVIEHVGSFENQIQMIGECARVARESFFITTPNPWFPVEFHTVLPLVHWMPKPAFRKLMAAIGKPFFALEANLNLMSRKELLRAAKTACGDEFEISVKSVSLAAWPSNLLLVGKRR